MASGSWGTVDQMNVSDGFNINFRNYDFAISSFDDTSPRYKMRAVDPDTFQYVYWITYNPTSWMFNGKSNVSGSVMAVLPRTAYTRR